ncbi:MAG: cupredoxin domain-containing protein [Solirubrobacterales bacterium]|nr:cupredoxin domain-containing protein [Solirubrobacterales bacterium]
MTRLSPLADPLPLLRRLALLLGPLLLIALAGCGSSSSSSSATSSAAPASSTSASAASSTSGAASGAASAGGTVKVTMKNLAFAPPAVNAKVGRTVEWVNDDQPPHNVTYVSGPKFTSSGTMNMGATFKLKLSQPGTIHYVCTIHPFMKATIVVSK